MTQRGHVPLSEPFRSYLYRHPAQKGRSSTPSLLGNVSELQVCLMVRNVLLATPLVWWWFCGFLDCI